MLVDRVELESIAYEKTASILKTQALGDNPISMGDKNRLLNMYTLYTSGSQVMGK